MECQPQIKNLPSSLSIMEVGPRDGLQNETLIIDTPTKISFVNSLVDAGVRRIEVGAFVSPKWIPQLADCGEVFARITRSKQVAFAALIPNMIGYERALAAQVDEVSFVISASNTHNLKNLNNSTENILSRYTEVAMQAHRDGIPFRAYISCAFGCPYEGDISLDQVNDLAQQVLQMGAYQVVISDTIGVASPKDICNILGLLTEKIAINNLALHLHDTRGCALACIYSAMMFGLRNFDSSCGGLGGCPYAPGAAGNVASEDLVYMATKMGIKTGINLDLLVRASLAIEKKLNKTLPSKIVTAQRVQKI